MKKPVVITVAVLAILSCSPYVLGQRRNSNSTKNLIPFIGPTTSKIGYLDITGKIAIQPRFNLPCRNVSTNNVPVECVRETLLMSRMSEGFARIEDRGLYGFVSKSGDVRIQPKFHTAGQFSESLAWVGIQDKYGYINTHGQLVIEPTFDQAGNFSEGLAWVKVGERYGYITPDSKIAIRPVFFEAANFSEGLAKVRVGDRYGYIDRSGKVVISARFASAGSFSGGLANARVEGGKWGYIGTDGAFKIRPTFDFATEFSEDLAFVKTANTSMYIDRRGERQLGPFRFSDGGLFKDGLALVFLKPEVFDPPRDPARQPSGRIPIRWVIGYGYIDKQGKWVHRGQAIFDGLSPLGTGSGDYYQEPSLVNVIIDSKPKGAKIYLVPLTIWDDDNNIINDDTRLFSHLQPTYTRYVNQINAQTYVVILELKGKKVKRQLDVNRFKDNTVEVDFDKERE